MSYRKINKRNLLLLSSASKGFSLKDVNDALCERMMRPITDLDWNLWVNFYLPLAIDDITYEQEILYNNRGLSWFARDLKKRHTKPTIS